MIWIKDRKHRGALALLLSLTAALLFGAAPEGHISKDVPCTLAWWGTLYPKFCFSQKPENAPEPDGDETAAGPEAKPVRMKTSFWIARLFRKED